MLAPKIYSMGNFAPFLGKTIISEFMVYINTSLKRKKVKMVFLLVYYNF